MSSPHAGAWPVVVAAAAVAWIAPGPLRTTAHAEEPLQLEAVAASIPPRVEPGESLAVMLSVRNTGSLAWNAGDVVLHYAGDGSWGGANLTLGASVEPNGVAQVAGTLAASTRVGLYVLRWQPVYRGTTSFGAQVLGRTEITCSNGDFCDGEERWNGSRCVAGPDPCDDDVPCTVDTCDSAAGRCTNVVPASAPAGCVACHTNCVPHCNGKQCGNDGCGGSCGTCTVPGDVCIDFTCQPAPTTPGTCANPDASSIVVPAVLPAPDDPIIVTGDTTSGFNVSVPRCNDTSPAPEYVYAFETTTAVGLEVRTYGYDTVAHIRSSCLDSATTVACNDDGTPPGGYGSRISTVLGPGTHYLAVDGYDAGSYGPFTMELRWRAGCAPACDGKSCGDDGCGGTCGSCAGGQCVGGQCVPDPCVPDCNGRQCGGDGCGGSCGTCDSGELCVVADGKCRKFQECDHLRPACHNGCNHDEFCGTDCECHKIRNPLPDLVIDEARLASDVVFDAIEVGPLSCSVVEGCVDGTGTRDVMRFSVAAINQGQADLVAPPTDRRPDLFAYSPCHGHYHYEGFAEYDLLDQSGTVVRQGHKQAYCMEDSGRALGVQEGSTVQCEKRYDCERQGIQRGWFDLYGNSLDCQWVDITGLASGLYYLRVRLNPPRTFQEVSFDNNTALVPVSVP